jgi:hypothetical protein
MRLGGKLAPRARADRTPSLHRRQQGSSFTPGGCEQYER